MSRRSKLREELLRVGRTSGPGCSLGVLSDLSGLSDGKKASVGKKGQLNLSVLLKQKKKNPVWMGGELVLR